MKETIHPAPTFTMIKENAKVDAILFYYRDHIGPQFHGYRNHVYRVLNFCVHLDPSPENFEKYMVAAVFHDLGIWTSKTFDYLMPSRQLAVAYLTENKQTDWIEEVERMIDLHHKRSVYRGEFEQTIETFRKADWIDVTRGKRKYQVPKDFIDHVNNEFSNAGFHSFLIIMSVKNFFKNPFNPLPMFRS